MIRKTETGAPQASPPQVESTKATETTKEPEAAKQPDASTTTAATPLQLKDTTRMRAEHGISGQARAAQLNEPAAGATKDASPATGTPEPEQRLLHQGKKGDDVKDAQQQINQWRQGTGKDPIAEDGKFGPKTDAAVKDFQKTNGLKPDGIIGPNTRDRLSLENNEDFKKVNPDVQKQVRDQMNAYSKDQTSRTNLSQLATDPNFAKMSKEGQEAALKKLGANPQDAANLKNIQENVKDRANLETNENFKKLNTDTQKKVLESMDKYSNDPASRAQLSTLASDASFGKLNPTHQEKALKTLENNPTDPKNLDNLQKMIGSESFQKMDDSLKTRTLDMAATHAANTRYTGDLSKLTSDPKFGALSTADKAKVLNVFENTSPDGRQALQGLLNKSINGQPALLMQGIGSKETTLDQLNKLSTSNIDPRVADASGTPAGKAKVTEDLLKELNDPGKYINQNNRGTCTVTSMTYDLANKNPAEYARLVTDLATTGQAKLADGNTITPPTDGFIQDNSTRSVGERLLQSSLMNYANKGNYQNWNPGPDGNRGTPDDGFADPTNPTSRSLDGVPPGGNSGMTRENQVKVMNGLFNKKFEYYDGSFNFKDDKKDILDKTKDELKAGRSPVYTHVDWGSGSHIVEVTKIENGRVYFRNPWGGNIPGVDNGVGPTDPPGTTPARTPPRRVEDGPNAIESMSEADYLKLINGVAIEKR